VIPVIAQDAPIFTGEWLTSSGVRVLIILAVAAILLFLARLVVRRMQRKLEGVDSLTQEYNLQRNATLTQALTYALRVVVLTVTVLLLLGEFGIALAPLIAGAGIVGVALGFGAQSLVRDFLSGFFILLENQFGVGDVIDVVAMGGSVTGTVETLSFRTTWVRSFEGILHIIPNGNIQMVGNRSRGWARAIVDVGLAYGQDIDWVKEILDELFEDVKASRGKLKEDLYAGPSVLGPEHLDKDHVVLRVVAETRPSRKADIERELRKRILKRFDERGVRTPAATVQPEAGKH
jgi:moderate conductance mechanosensitive channel